MGWMVGNVKRTMALELAAHQRLRAIEANPDSAAGQLMDLTAMVEEMPDADRLRIAACQVLIRKIVRESGELGEIALVLVGGEWAVQNS